MILCGQILVVVDAQLQEQGLPTRAYVSVEEVHDVRAPRMCDSRQTEMEISGYIYIYIYVCVCVRDGDIRREREYIYIYILISLGSSRCGLFKDGTPASRTFEHVASEIGAEEAEEVLLIPLSYFNYILLSRGYEYYIYISIYMYVCMYVKKNTFYTYIFLSILGVRIVQNTI